MPRRIIRGVSSCQSKKFNAAFPVCAAREKLSLARSREILGNDCPKSDAELERLRDGYYAFARVLVEAFLNQRRENTPLHALNHAGSVLEGEGWETPTASFSELAALLPEDRRYDLEERAAIHEFDGGLDRSAAELAAFSEFWREKHQL